MNRQQKSLRVGLTAVACAVILRFFSCVRLEPVLRFLTRPEVVAFLMYADTGQAVPAPTEDLPPPPILYPTMDFPSESPPAVPPPLPDFQNPGLVELTYLCSYRPDLEALLRKPLSWDLASGAPSVLIFHTHTTESYDKNGADYAESAPYRTTDERYNILAVGDRITELLEEKGIVTIHDRSFYDYPNYNGCYGRTRKAAAQYIKEYPSLKLILDLHRDANDGTFGQLETHAQVNGQDSAQLMLVVGSNAGGLPHRNWPENLALGLKLHAQLETQCPGIVRPLSFRSQRFNQDLSPGALLIEVGAAGDTCGEAVLAGEELARAIIALARGAGEPASEPVPLSGSPG